MRCNHTRAYQLDAENIRIEITDYLNGNNANNRRRMYLNPDLKWKYGVNIYRSIAEALIADPPLIDLRVFRLLVEHKHIMIHRAYYLEQKRVIREGTLEKIILLLKEPLKTAEIIKNKVLKVILAEDYCKMESISLLLNKLKTEEERSLELLLHSIVFWGYETSIEESALSITGGEVSRRPQQDGQSLLIQVFLHLHRFS